MKEETPSVWIRMAHITAFFLGTTILIKYLHKLEYSGVNACIPS